MPRHKRKKENFFAISKNLNKYILKLFLLIPLICTGPKNQQVYNYASFFLTHRKDVPKNLYLHIRTQSQENNYHQWNKEIYFKRASDAINIAWKMSANLKREKIIFFVNIFILKNQWRIGKRETP